ncbi:MaoC/PaaZ C-terminal domain-containing protein [Saccharopolyspora taberi]|uniref:MaoC/PaaZ C-terminal domain-containing protein n=1 Tax=Saccharopolyspora taberi TaxID=60895 RepID=A0ABN3VI01_9PSEU
MGEPVFQEAGLGRWTEEETFEVTARHLGEYAAATNDPIPRHRAGEIAPPVFGIVPVFGALVPAALSVAPPELLGRLVHGKHDFRFHRPILPGDRLVSRAKPVGFTAKPAGTTVAVRTETRREDGEPVNEQWMTAFFRKVDAGRSVGHPAPPHRFDESLRAKPPAAEVTAHIDGDQTFRYAPASGDPMPIHLDEEMARMAGLPGIIVHGMCTMAFTSWALLTEFAGGDTRRLRRLAVRFAKPVLPGQDITVRMWRGAVSPQGTTYSYETTAAGEAVIKDGLAVIAD